MKDVAAPLSGFDKAVSTGFELAQNQEKIGLAQRQNQLEQEKIQVSYLDKANNLLPNLLKTTGKARSLLTNSYMNLMAKGGMPVNKDTMDLLAADESVASGYVAIEDKIRKQYPNDPVRQAAARAQYLGLPPSDVMTQVTGVAKAELGIEAAQKRAVLQRLGIKETAVAGQKLKRLYKISDETNKVTEDTTKQLGTINRSITSIESALASNDYKRLQTIIGDLAKGVGGLSGVLSDLDMKTQLARSLGTDLAGLEGYFFGKATIPKETFKQIKSRMMDFKQALTVECTNKLFDQISNKQMDPTVGDAYQFKSTKQGLQIGFAAARLLDRSNKVFTQLKTSAGEMSLEEWFNAQAAKPSQQQIMKVVEDALKQNIIVRFSPASVMSPPSEEEIYGLQQGYSAPMADSEEE